MLLEACKFLSHEHNYILHTCLGESYDYLLVQHIKNLVLEPQASEVPKPYHVYNFVQMNSREF